MRGMTSKTIVVMIRSDILIQTFSMKCDYTQEILEVYAIKYICLLLSFGTKI